MNGMIAEAQLARLGCSCDIAIDGKEALQRLREGVYDLVLMDCMLPGLSGYATTQAWRAEEQATGRPRLPIVALTANALSSNAEQCERAGMDDYLTKPCTVEKLDLALGAVNCLLENLRAALDMLDDIVLFRCGWYCYRPAPDDLRVKVWLRAKVHPCL